MNRIWLLLFTSFCGFMLWAYDDIRLNQVGYYPKTVKQFVVVNSTATTFKIQNSSSKTLYEGKLIDRGLWKLSNEWVKTGDFSKFQKQGKYRVFILDKGTSHPFEIKDHLYRDLLTAALKSYYFQRASMALEEKHGGKWKRPMGHPDNRCTYHPSSGRTGGFRSCPGGWYDAGDYNKYIVNAGVSVCTMLALYEHFPAVIKDGSTNIPESGNGISDLLDELKYELDWVLTMQDDDGGVFYKITSKKFDGFIMPHQATIERFVVGKATASTLNFAAMTAQAARIFRDIDKTFSTRCLLASKRAWQWAHTHKDRFYKNPPDIKTGEYGDEDMNEEFFWAATELLITTLDDHYRPYVDAYIEKVKNKKTESWRHFIAQLGCFSLASAQNASIAVLRHKAVTVILQQADDLLKEIKTIPYRVPMNRFQWGSNGEVANDAVILAYAYDITGKQEYLDAVVETVDYLLGKNATAYSFITGFGDKTPQNIHHRASSRDRITDPIPGFVVGGPNNDRQDDINKQKLYGVKYPFKEPAKSYVDLTGSFASNEVCLNWNAPFVFILGFLEANVDKLQSPGFAGQTVIQPIAVKKKVEELLSRMTLEEKVGQMTQVTLAVISKNNKDGKNSHEIDMGKLRTAVVKYKVGSIFNVVDSAFPVKHWHEIIQTIQDIANKETRLKIPVLYGIDSIHGANYVMGATIFPQSIGMAATFNPELVKKEGEITAHETRACGIHWNFNPVLGLGRQPLWPRLFETYGEDPYLASVLGKAYIKGQEGESNVEAIKKNRVVSCIKHYLGYSFPLSGKDRTPAWIPERMLREYFLPPFAHGVLSGAHTLMINSTEINGIPVHASPFYLKKILRDELGFEGFVVSDWMDIKMLHTRSRVATSQKEAVKIAIMAGVDMSMVPLDFSFYRHLVELVKEGEVPISRIDEAVKRILMIKYKVGLFEYPYPDKILAKTVGSPVFTAVALNAARESITLLKNKNNILPIPKGQRILVTGPNAHKLSVLNGGWTYTWQGDKEKRYPREKDTVLEAIRKKYGKDKVSYVPGCEYEREIDIQKAINKAREMDFIIACLGEKAYCESEGDINNLELPEVQSKLVSRLHKTGKPIVLVLTEGRPRLIHKIIDKVDGILMAYLPGNEGGQAITEVLTGEVNPSGKLPITYPKYTNDWKCYDYKYSENTRPNKYNPEFPFGFGLSYTEFEYKSLTLNKMVMKINDKIRVTVTVKNKGNIKGKEVVQLYISDLYASITPSVRRLKRFKKIELKPGEEKEVTFILTKEDFSFIGKDMKLTVEHGEFRVSSGSLTKKFKLTL